MGNRFQKQQPYVQPSNDREAMDVILELSEQKMNEGDYLKISECLKVIHESKQPNIVPTYKIFNSSMIEPDALYRLTCDETIQLMRARYKDYYESCIMGLEETIAEDQRGLRETTNEKKAAWIRLQQDHTIKSRQAHKQLVQQEKLLKVKINELLKEIYKMEDILEEFKVGNYNTVHL